MITIKSNINSFLKAYRKRINPIINVLPVFAEKLAKKMSEDMQNFIKTDNRWKDNGNLSRVNTVDFRTERLSDNSVRVFVGENLPQFEMRDGTMVNPAFFIEFGFGIVGENKPKQRADKYSWRYNINDRGDAWWFKFDGEWFKTKGKEGLNFIYIIMDKYRNGWREYFEQLIREQGNG